MFEFLTSLFAPVLMFFGFTAPTPEPISVEPAPVTIHTPVVATTSPDTSTSTASIEPEPVDMVIPEPAVVPVAEPISPRPPTLTSLPDPEEPSTEPFVLNTPSERPTNPLTTPSTTTVEGVNPEPICGDSHKETLSSVPSQNLCAAGVAANTELQDSEYSWQCVSGDAETDCKAFITTHGACGVSSDVLLPNSYDKDVLCLAETLTNKQSNFGELSWTCEGLHDGYDATCSAKLASAGSCGSAQGQTFSSFPTASLCKLGEITNRTEDDYHFMWNCTGVNGGNDARCAAFIDVPEVSSPASEQIIPCYKDLFLTPCDN